jgi:hypothetical protein
MLRFLDVSNGNASLFLESFRNLVGRTVKSLPSRIGSIQELLADFGECS